MDHNELPVLHEQDSARIHYLNYGDKLYPYTILYVPRKTIGIVVEVDGSILVRVSPGVPNEKVATIIEKKRKWIIKKIRESQLIK